MSRIIISAGLILRIPIWDQPRGHQIFDDENFWMMPVDEEYRVTSESPTAELPLPLHTKNVENGADTHNDSYTKTTEPPV